MSYWHDKVALVTGGSAGLGLHVANALSAEGAKLAICGRSPSRLEQAADGMRGLGVEVLTLAADVSQPGETRRVVDLVQERFGELDLACCCAGKSMRGAVVETPRAAFQELLEINFLAVLDMAQAAGPLLEAAEGHLVMIGSLATHVAPRYLGAYPASKHPLAALSQQLRLERGPEGLHVLLVCPGPIARPDGGARYQQQAEGLPSEAAKPGGGAKVSRIEPDQLAQQILRACERRTAELVVPRKARLLFALSKLSPTVGDWLLNKKMG